MDAASIIALGTAAAQAFNKAFSMLPDEQKRALNEYFKFKDKYLEEVSRADADFDDLLAWRERDLLLQQTINQKVARPSKE